MKTLKIVRKTPTRADVLDIEVADAHHYVLGNGVVSHNSIGGNNPHEKTIGGGCIIAGTRIMLADGKLSSIESIMAGDLVMTYTGPRRVTETWNPSTLLDGHPECLEIEFDDGTRVVCSEDHSFLIGDRWIRAADLCEGDDVETIKSINNSGIKPDNRTYVFYSLQDHDAGKNAAR